MPFLIRKFEVSDMLPQCLDDIQCVGGTIENIFLTLRNQITNIL